LPDLLIRGGRIVDPSQHLDAKRDLRIRAGVVAAIAESIEPEDGERVLDASGCVVAPGFVDMHVHLREPGFAYKETVATGTLAAVRGGFTSIACMPNTNPALDDPRVLEGLMAIVKRDAHCRVYPIAAITVARAGAVSTNARELARAGAVAFSDDGNTVMNARVLRDAALAALDVPGPFISHAEDELLKGDAVMTLGETSRRLGVPGVPSIAEDTIVARDLLVALDTGKPWHIAHVSTARALDLLRWARERGVRATAEVTPHHVYFSDRAVPTLGAAAKVNPPLRAEDDVGALRQGVRDGTIDAFATDHAPHATQEKRGDLAAAAVGFTGLEIAAGAYALALGDLPLERYVALLSCNPARILGIGAGTLRVSSVADATIFADRAWTVDASRFASKGKTTPFDGLTLPRRIEHTVVGGSIVYSRDAT
jgi:dihydroorotase